METPTYVPRSQQGSSDFPPSPGSSRVNAEVSPDGTLRYVCFICHKSYAQRQGVWLHIRTAHNPKPKHCSHCEFSWARPYEYKNHLKKKHPDVDPDLILGKAPGSRRRATILTEHLPQQPPVSPPAVEQDQQNWAESQPNPSAPPSRPGAGGTSVSPPAVSSVDYNLQPVYAEQTATMDEHEYAHKSELRDATNHLTYHSVRLPSAHPGGLTATHSPSNPKMAPFPRLSPPMGENYGALVSEDPVVESIGLMLYIPLSDADIDAIFDSLLANSAF